MYSYPFHYTPYERKSVGVGESGLSYRSGMTSLNRSFGAKRLVRKIYHTFAIEGHIVIDDAAGSQTAAHRIPSEGCVCHVIHMRDIKPGMRSGKRHIPDIFIIHDETAILKSLSRTGIEGDHFRLVFLNGCSYFLIPDGIAGQIECFSSLASKRTPMAFPQGIYVPWRAGI